MLKQPAVMFLGTGRPYFLLGWGRVNTANFLFSVVCWGVVLRNSLEVSMARVGPADLGCGRAEEPEFCFQFPFLSVVF